MLHRAQFVVPLTDEADFEVFRPIQNSCTELRLEKSRGLNATELVDTLLITIFTSAAYDLVKSSVLALLSRLREYRKARSLKITVDGVHYLIQEEADIDRLERDLKELIDTDHDAESNGRN